VVAYQISSKTVTLVFEL